MSGVIGMLMGASTIMNTPGDPEERIADLERQLNQQRRINDLEHQLDAARREAPAPEAVGVNVSDLLGSLNRLADGAASWRQSPVGPPVDTRLSSPPRPIPLRFVIAELLPFRWWYLTVMFVVAIPAAIVWATTPRAALPAAILTLVLIYVWQLVGTRTRLQLLKWGRVATVTKTEIASRASYYGGTTWYNAPLPIANGWRVTRPLWSGPSTTTTVGYTLDDYHGELSVRGREYLDGVILADERHPDRARCVTYFPYDLNRDDTGNWIGRLRPRLMLGMVVWLVILIGWVGGATAISTGAATRMLQHSQEITVDQGASARIDGSSLSRHVTCKGGDLTVDGTHVTVTVTGHCTKLTVTGIGNTVTIDNADTVFIDGIDNHVVHHSGVPSVDLHGIRNTETRLN